MLCSYGDRSGDCIQELVVANPVRNKREIHINVLMMVLYGTELRWVVCGWEQCGLDTFAQFMNAIPMQ